MQKFHENDYNSLYQEDAFHQEINAFLRAIRENLVPIPLSTYLEALLVAEQLKQKLQ